MNETKTILICGDQSAAAVSLATGFQELGWYAFIRPQATESLRKAIYELHPDAVIFNDSFPNHRCFWDNLALARGTGIFTLVLTVSERSGLERFLMHTENVRCLPLPASFSSIFAILRDVFSEDASQSRETIATTLICRFGIPANLRGYQYLRTAILMVADDAALIHFMTKKLYPQVAKAFETTPSCVERSIRHAIDLAWSREGAIRSELTFGTRMNMKPSNSELIAVLADMLRLGSPLLQVV